MPACGDSKTGRWRTSKCRRKAVTRARVRVVRGRTGRRKKDGAWNRDWKSGMARALAPTHPLRSFLWRVPTDSQHHSHHNDIYNPSRQSKAREQMLETEIPSALAARILRKRSWCFRFSLSLSRSRASRFFSPSDRYHFHALSQIMVPRAVTKDIHLSFHIHDITIVSWDAHISGNCGPTRAVANQDSSSNSISALL